MVKPQTTCQHLMQQHTDGLNECLGCGKKWRDKMTETTPFVDMLSTVISDSECMQKDFAKAVGISPQFLCDLLQGKRGPSPKLVDKICRYMGRGPKGRKAWHEAGARSVGWEI